MSKQYAVNGVALRKQQHEAYRGCEADRSEREVYERHMTSSEWIKRKFDYFKDLSFPFQSNCLLQVNAGYQERRFTIAKTFSTAKSHQVYTDRESYHRLIALGESLLRRVQDFSSFSKTPSEDMDSDSDEATSDFFTLASLFSLASIQRQLQSFTSQSTDLTTR